MTKLKFNPSISKKKLIKLKADSIELKADSIELKKKHTKLKFYDVFYT